jgi:putative drug exporter of the RND superfamily
MRTLAGWCVNHRRLVLLIWAIVLVVSLGLSNAVGTAYSNSFNFPKTESFDAIKLLQASAPKDSGDTEQIVFATSGGAKVTDPDVMASINEMIGKIEQLPHVGRVDSPYTAAGASQISKDGTVAFIPVTLNRQQNLLTESEGKQFVATAKTADGPHIQVAVSGQLAELTNPQSFSGTGVGVLLAFVVLILVFGSFFAAILPIVSALFALGTAVGLIGLLTHVLKIPSIAPILVLLIGLGVGVDYALFIVTRHRQGLVAGQPIEKSIINAVNTSGRAVLFAGIIVCIALLGMFALGVSFLYGLAVSAAIGVLFTMISALTLLPGMLGFIGPKVMSRKQKRGLAENGPRIVGVGTTGFWPRWADRIQRRPAVSATAALLVIVVIALPFFSLRLGSTDQGSDPTGTTTRTAYNLLAKGFGPGFNGPLQLVSVVSTPADKEVITKVSAEVAKQPDVASVSDPVYIPSKTGTDSEVALVNVFPKTAPQDAATTDLIHQLRDVTIPQTVGDSGVKILVGGDTAIFVDFAHVLSSKLPLFIALVVILSFILLAIVFRSLIIPLTAAVMNLLSIGAAFGILVAVYQWGYIDKLFGIDRTGPVESFIPVLLFAILFGLSMDYQVFLVSRMHEEFLKTGDNRTAVRNGLAATGKTITAAALIMILVFASFVLGGQAVIKEFGIGLAGGVLVDAVLIRMAVVPSLMMLLGKANWWFPKGLDRVLPKLSVDADDLATLPAAPVPDPELV